MNICDGFPGTEEEGTAGHTGINATAAERIARKHERGRTIDTVL